MSFGMMLDLFPDFITFLNSVGLFLLAIRKAQK